MADFGGDFDLSTKKKKKKSSKKTEEAGELVIPAVDSASQKLIDSLTSRKKKPIVKKKKSTFSTIVVEEAIASLLEQLKTATVEINKPEAVAQAVIETKPEDAPVEEIHIKGQEEDEDIASSSMVGVDADKSATILQDERDILPEGEEEGPESWVKSERDYTYTEMLRRVYTVLRAKNPELSGSRGRVSFKPPMVLRDGTRKSVFANFAEICNDMHRQPDHLIAFILAELGTSGNLDGSERLVIRGRFQPAQIESLLRKYMKEYCVCHMCRSLDTALLRDPHTRLYSLKCSSCGASRTVIAIKGASVKGTTGSATTPSV